MYIKYLKLLYINYKNQLLKDKEYLIYLAENFEYLDSKSSLVWAFIKMLIKLFTLWPVIFILYIWSLFIKYFAILILSIFEMHPKWNGNRTHQILIRIFDILETFFGSVYLIDFLEERKNKWNYFWRDRFEFYAYEIKNTDLIYELNKLIDKTIYYFKSLKFYINIIYLKLKRYTKTFYRFTSKIVKRNYRTIINWFKVRKIYLSYRRKIFSISFSWLISKWKYRVKVLIIFIQKIWPKKIYNFLRTWCIYISVGFYIIIKVSILGLIGIIGTIIIFIFGARISLYIFTIFAYIYNWLLQKCTHLYYIFKNKKK